MSKVIQELGKQVLSMEENYEVGARRGAKKRLSSRR